MKDFDRTLGSALALVRGLRGLSGAEVAGRLGLAGTTWFRIENGQRRVQLAEVGAISEVLGIPPASLLEPRALLSAAQVAVAKQFVDELIEDTSLPREAILEALS